MIGKDAVDGIKAVLFDLDGTLRINLPSGGEVFTNYAIQLGMPVTIEIKKHAARWEHYYFATSTELLADREKFKEDSEKFWVNFGRRRLMALGSTPKQAEDLSGKLAEYMRESYKPVVSVPEKAHTLLASLRYSGLILGMVSNREKTYTDELEQLGLNNYFHFSLAGGEVAAYKPQPEIFQHALEMAGTRASEAIYVGDNYFSDVLGARRAGLKPVLYDPEGIFPDADCEVIHGWNEFILNLG